MAQQGTPQHDPSLDTERAARETQTWRTIAIIAGAWLLLNMCSEDPEALKEESYQEGYADGYSVGHEEGTEEGEANFKNDNCEITHDGRLICDDV